jgi:hypothetical protein
VVRKGSAPTKEWEMSIERMLRIMGGAFVLLSLALGHFSNPNWYWFTAFVGLNLFQSGFTNWCPMVAILKKAGMKWHDAPTCCAVGTDHVTQE